MLFFLLLLLHSGIFSQLSHDQVTGSPLLTQSLLSFHHLSTFHNLYPSFLCLMHRWFPLFFFFLFFSAVTISSISSRFFLSTLVPLPIFILTFFSVSPEWMYCTAAVLSSMTATTSHPHSPLLNKWNVIYPHSTKNSPQWEFKCLISLNKLTTKCPKWIGALDSSRKGLRIGFLNPGLFVSLNASVH